MPPQLFLISVTEERCGLYGYPGILLWKTRRFSLFATFEESNVWIHAQWVQRTERARSVLIARGFGAKVSLDRVLHEPPKTPE